MTGGEDATAEALFRLLYGRATAGFAVIGVARGVTNRGMAWERHAFDVSSDSAGWVAAVEMLTRHGLRAEIWPYACSAQVLRGIGTGAFSPGKDTNLRSWQSVVAVEWIGAPSAEALSRFVKVGGSVIARFSRHFGLLPLLEARPFGDLNNLTREVATTLGAVPLGSHASVPMPGTWDAAFVTDVMAALTREPASGDDIALAGLRTQRVPGVTPEVAA